MVWRTVVVSNPARLSCTRNQLTVSLESDTVTVPIEDLALLLIDHPQVVITAPLLQSLSESSVGLIVCDSKHLPCGELISTYQHSRYTEMLRYQVDMSRPLKKKVWRKIVLSKINNQSLCLMKNKKEGATQLRHLSKQVKSGDPYNIEAQAARQYWTNLFGESFKRRADSEVSSALNYGYAILRSAVARGFSSVGLHLALGVHHDNKLNPMCLVDDFIEPFRPIVDDMIVELFSGGDSFGKEQREKIVNVVNREVYIGEEMTTILRAIEICAHSYIHSMKSKKDSFLLFPHAFSNYE